MVDHITHVPSSTIIYLEKKKMDIGTQWGDNMPYWVQPRYKTHFIQLSIQIGYILIQISPANTTQYGTN